MTKAVIAYMLAVMGQHVGYYRVVPYSAYIYIIK